MMKLVNFLFGLVIGALIGAAVILLTTPQSGSALQAEARARWDRAMEEAKQASSARRVELEARLASLQRR